jgi:hypothetical protein
MPAVGCRLTKSSWRVGGIGDVGLGGWLGVTGFSLRRGRVGQPDSTVHLQVFFGASRAVAFAGFVIAQAGQIVAVADTVTISGRGCCFDRDEGHTASNERSSVQYGWYAGQVQTRNCGAKFLVFHTPFHWSLRIPASFSRFWNPGASGTFVLCT